MARAGNCWRWRAIHGQREVSEFVIPAKAAAHSTVTVDSRLRGNDWIRIVGVQEPGIISQRICTAVVLYLKPTAADFTRNVVISPMKVFPCAAVTLYSSEA